MLLAWIAFGTAYLVVGCAGLQLATRSATHPFPGVNGSGDVLLIYLAVILWPTWLPVIAADFGTYLRERDKRNER